MSFESGQTNNETEAYPQLFIGTPWAPLRKGKK